MPTPLRSLIPSISGLILATGLMGGAAHAQGLVITPIAPGNRADIARTAALLPTGELFVAGTALGSYNEDHAAGFYPLYPSLGSPIVRTTAYNPANTTANADYAAGSVALGGDNVVTAGVAYTYPNTGYVGTFALTWWNHSGAYLKVETALNPNKKGKPTTKSRAVELLQAADGSLIAVGVDEGGGTRLAVVRYNASTGAVLATNQTDLAFEPRGAVLSGSALYVVGRSLSDDRMAVVKTNLNGKVTTNWGSGGMVLLGATGSSAEAAAIDAAGRLLVAGTAGGDDRPAAVLRLKPNGNLDPTFAVGGVATVDLGGSDDTFTAINLRANGLIVATGHASDLVNSFSYGRFAAAQFLENGGLDAAGFGVGGVSIIPIRDSAYCNDAKIQDDGRLVMVGEARTIVSTTPTISTNRDFAVLQLDVFGRP